MRRQLRYTPLFPAPLLLAF